MNNNEQKPNDIRQPVLHKANVRRSALLWWSKLSKSKQAEYENRFFGVSSIWEYGELREADIIRLFQRFANVEALAKKGHLKNECSAIAPKFYSTTKVEFTTSSPFFANAMLVAGVLRYRFGRPS